MTTLLFVLDIIAAAAALFAAWLWYAAGNARNGASPRTRSWTTTTSTGW